MSLWKAVQERLEANRNGHKSKSHAADPSLLSGKLGDETGQRLIPSHTRKGNKRNRYYVTPLEDPGEPIRLPANEIEQVLVKAIMNRVSNQKRVVDAVGGSDARGQRCDCCRQASGGDTGSKRPGSPRPMR